MLVTNSWKLKKNFKYTIASKMKYLQINIVKELQDVHIEYSKNITETRRKF